jgi:hypothetical protein
MLKDLNVKALANVATDGWKQLVKSSDRIITNIAVHYTTLLNPAV